MAALLDRTDLHRHALPDGTVAGLDVALDLRWLGYAPRRPRLFAAWQAGAHGRPVCRWTFAAPDGAAPDGAAPDHPSG